MCSPGEWGYVIFVEPSSPGGARPTCGARGPAPLHEGAPTLWHLAPLLDWLRHDKGYPVPDELLELAQATMKVNTAVDSLRTDDATRDEIRALFG